MLVEETVERIMESTVVNVRRDETVRRALELMVEHDVGAVIVTSKDKLVGIVTERDVVKKTILEKLDLSKKVGNVMSKPLITAEIQTPLTDALSLMVEHDIRRLPILKKGRLVGILLERDIIRWLARRPDVVLDFLAITDPEVVKEALTALLKEFKRKKKK